MPDRRVASITCSRLQPAGGVVAIAEQQQHRPRLAGSTGRSCRARKTASLSEVEPSAVRPVKRGRSGARSLRRLDGQNAPVPKTSSATPHPRSRSDLDQPFAASIRFVRRSPARLPLVSSTQRQAQRNGVERHGVELLRNAVVGDDEVLGRQIRRRDSGRSSPTRRCGPHRRRRERSAADPRAMIAAPTRPIRTAAATGAHHLRTRSRSHLRPAVIERAVLERPPRRRLSSPFRGDSARQCMRTVGTSRHHFDVRERDDGGLALGRDRERLLELRRGPRRDPSRSCRSAPSEHGRRDTDAHGSVAAARPLLERLARPAAGCLNRNCTRPSLICASA